MVINPTISNFSLPKLDGTDLTALGHNDVDEKSALSDDASVRSGLSGDELMAINVWGAGSKMLVDQRALNSQAMSAQDIVGLLIVRG